MDLIVISIHARRLFQSSYEVIKATSINLFFFGFLIFCFVFGVCIFVCRKEKGGKGLGKRKSWGVGLGSYQELLRRVGPHTNNTRST